MKEPSSLLAVFDRELVLWGLAPCGFAALVVGLFAVPNYMRAQTMKDDAQRLKAVTNETITAQNNLRTLERMVTGLREERDHRCRPLSDGAERDRLLTAITRATDGLIVQEQSIRTGPVTAAEYMPADFPVMKRDITVEMLGTFDAIFGVLDAAEAIDQLVTPRAIEFVIVPSAAEQAQSGNSTVKAHIIFEEWFQPGAVRLGGGGVTSEVFKDQEKKGGAR